MDQEKNDNLEEIMEQLNDIVGRLESESMTLEESFQCFSQGINLVAAGNKAIDKVEKKMQILMEEGEEDEF